MNGNGGAGNSGAGSVAHRAADAATDDLRMDRRECDKNESKQVNGQRVEVLHRGLLKAMLWRAPYAGSADADA